MSGRLYEWRTMIVQCGGHLVTIIAFAAFVRWNGGIVVGDREAHTASLHLMQLPYLCLFASGAMCFLLRVVQRYADCHARCLLWLCRLRVLWLVTNRMLASLLQAPAL
jgi:DIE2/ALG10 family